ncbi:MAG: DNA translocase FtsK 4TM domain-containing protein [Alphaproteobacteria bacterium]|jgi:S-DNA-T family DNA segregation ATPase FtsK/SpoIIIE|nr:DNA translocase FtsK 4TM domain-containing protein [Alphaproteobacteria bacterium]
MALSSRSYSRHAFLPSGVTAFLRRRAGQFMGLFTIFLAVMLAAILGTYHSSDPSWNLAIEGPANNILAFPGAVVADVLLQTFGLSAVFFIVALLGWGIRSLISLPLKWTTFRIFALVCAVLLSACVAAQCTPPKTWLLPNSLGGALGDIFLSQIHHIIGSSWASYIAVGLVFSVTSFFLLLLSLGLSFKQVGRAIMGMGLVFGRIILWFYDLLTRRLFKGRRREDLSDHEFNKLVLSKKKPVSPFALKVTKDMDPNEGRSPVIVSPDLNIMPEDREIFAPPMETDRSETPIIWPDAPLQDSEDGDVLEEVSSYISKKSPTKTLYSYDSTTDAGSIGWEDYELPSCDLLDPLLRKTTQAIDPKILEESAYHLKTVLEEFGVRGEVVTVRPGPVVTMYEFKPAAGIKTSRVIGLADDIARSMSALSARIAVIPGRNVIGIELPNATRETVYLRELLQTDAYEKTTTHLALILGKDIGGQPVIADLTRMPHLLVAGTTGSGKSVAVNTMILSLLFRLSPDQCKFIMIDPKMLELSVYDGIPHLLSPVVTDPKKAIVALKWAVREMENRYRAMSKLGVRNIDGYNVRVKEARQTGEMLVRRVQTGFDPDSGKPIFENQPLDLETLPYIVVVVDEMADLMMVAGKEIEAAVQRLAQMARAAGIHLIMATQRPSVDVITGTIKANFPTRISFQVTSKIDSRTILGEQGAEQLLGQGDMLYMAGGGRITRVHGPFVKDEEVERIVAFLKSQAEPVYIESVTDDEGEFINFDEDGGRAVDTLYTQAVDLVVREGKASTSFIQRHLQIGYNKAAGIIEQMEKNGVVSQANHVGKREVLR